MNYPKRGCVSKDGKFYTHTDGRVCRKKHTGLLSCRNCEFKSCTNGFNTASEFCGCSIFERIPGAYVPSYEEAEAFDMAVDAIAVCPGRDKDLNSCLGKGCFDLRICVMRKYLAAHKQPDAWEAK